MPQHNGFSQRDYLATTININALVCSRANYLLLYSPDGTSSRRFGSISTAFLKALGAALVRSAP